MERGRRGPGRGARVAAAGQFAEDVREDEALAQQLGIQGVPFFVFDRRYGVSGAQPVETLLDALERAWEEAVNLAGVSYSVLPAGEAFWRPSNQMGMLNTDLAKQLGAEGLGARFWRLRPGQALDEAPASAHGTSSTSCWRARDGSGSASDSLVLPRLSAVYVEPDSVRQVFNDGDADTLWLVMGAPNEAANTLEMSEETLAFLYPDGPKALPPELSS